MTATETDRIDRDAEISECGRYRYTLRRTWGNAAPVAFVMLNPSTADAREDDPTIRKCMAFARSWGHGGIVVVNLFALRATDPRALLSPKSPMPVGPFNDRRILEATEGIRVVAAWGCDKAIGNRDRAVMKLLSEADGDRFAVECLATTKDGYPKHPLYLRGDLVPVHYAGRK